MFPYSITLPVHLVHYEEIEFLNSDNTVGFYYQLTADETVIDWLKECTPDYKLLNYYDKKIAYFNDANDLLMFKLAFDIPSDISLD